ncbi:hypothetical protein DFJ74DRAFT_665787 [Hyaloraphidium curvatum]|nr:hypothetical protein DFJ74DRAFT_665787 [Hyaloraphidium curvatum]
MFRTASAAVMPLLRAGHAALSALCLDASGGFAWAMSWPRTVDEWIRVDSALRCFCVFTAFDNGASSYFGYPALIDATAWPAPLAAHERFFHSPDPKGAFDALVAAGAFGPHRFADLAAFARGPEVDAVKGALRHMVVELFSGRASFVTGHSLHAFFRSIRGKLRAFARNYGVDPIALTCKERDQLTPSEITYCDSLELVDNLTYVLVHAMPPDISRSLLAGDPVPLLTAPCFTHPAYAHAFFAMIFAVLCTWLEAAVDPPQGPSAPPPATVVFGSPTFLRVLDRAQLMSELMEHLRDEDLPLLYPVVALHSVRVGIVSLILFDVLRADNSPEARGPAERLRRNVEGTARGLATLGSGSHLVLAKLTADFIRAARAAGALGEDFPASKVPEEALDEVHDAQFASAGQVDRTSPVSALAKALEQLHRGLAAWLPQFEDPHPHAYGYG